MNASISTTAFAPGSVTTIFAPPANPQNGSFGVSFTVDDGVEATVRPTAETTVLLDNEPTEFEPVKCVLRRLNVSAEVSLTTSIPVGYGFGASGASTLAAALAANDVFNLGRSREDLLEAAHRAEVEAGTGLGDVFVQARGGLVWNDGDINGVQRSGWTGRVEYTALNEIATSDILGDDKVLERVRDHGRDSLSRFSPTESLHELLDLSWEFAQRTQLTTDQVVNEVRRIERAGGAASMAMVGETVIATGVQDVLEQSTHITTTGARIQ